MDRTILLAPVGSAGGATPLESAIQHRVYHSRVWSETVGPDSEWVASSRRENRRGPISFSLLRSFVPLPLRVMRYEYICHVQARRPAHLAERARPAVLTSSGQGRSSPCTSLTSSRRWIRTSRRTLTYSWPGLDCKSRSWQRGSDPRRCPVPLSLAVVIADSKFFSAPPPRGLAVRCPRRGTRSCNSTLRRTTGPSMPRSPSPNCTTG